MNQSRPKRVAPAFEGQWFHIIASTYGAWLHGDARGFRTRHHRQHVVGDYRDPPPALPYLNTRKHSLKSLKQPPVRIAAKWRPKIGRPLEEKLRRDGAFVLCIAVSSQHMHLLAKLPLGAEPRIWMGLAKKHVTFEVRQAGWQGKLWAKRGKELPVKDRRHQLKVYRYILAHKAQGAWVWNWMQDAAE